MQNYALDMITEFSTLSGVSVEELLGRSRKAEIVTARQLYWKLLHDELDYSFVRIAQLNERDHSTVSQGVRHVEALLESGDKYAAELWERVRYIATPLRAERLKELGFTCKTWYDKDGANDAFYTLRFEEFSKRISGEDAAVEVTFAYKTEDGKRYNLIDTTCELRVDDYYIALDARKFGDVMRMYKLLEDVKKVH